MELLFINGKLTEITKDKIYYNLKQKKYLSIGIPRHLDEMFKNWVKVNKNECIPNGDIIIPLNSRCLCFFLNDKPKLLQKGIEMKLFMCEGFFRDHRKNILLSPIYNSEQEKKYDLHGYSFFVDNKHYLVVYSKRFTNSSHIAKMFKKIVKWNDNGFYYFDFPCEDRNLCIEFAIRKDLRKNARKILLETLKERNRKQLKNAFYAWLVLH